MTNSTDSKDSLFVPQLLGIGMLGWAMVPTNPYGYYLVLRWVICGIFAYLAVQAYERQMSSWTWAFGVTAGIYNPIVRVHGTRELWTLVNLVTIALLISSMVVMRQSGECAKDPQTH